MNIFNKMKDLRKKDIIEDDIKLYTSVVYNSEKKLIILIEYSSQFNYDIIEFIIACNNSGIKIKSMSKEYEETQESQDDNDFVNKPIKIHHQRFYILISGNDKNYSDLLSNISFLSNPILLAIIKDIYNNRNPNRYEIHLNNNAMNVNEFKYLNKTNIPYDNIIEFMVDSSKHKYSIDDYSFILNNIPIGFNKYDILELVDVYLYNNINCNIITFFANRNDDTINAVNTLGNILGFDYKSIAKLHTTPKYLLDIDEVGDMELNDLDDMFKQSYDRFNAYNSESIEYKDIDEVVEQPIPPKEE